MALVPGGTYEPFFARKSTKEGVDLLIPEIIKVKPFWLDRTAVTNDQFLAFVITHPEWRKSAARPIFAEAHYLDRWPNDASWGEAGAANKPVTGVSWFAAEAYCEAKGLTLPTTDQWEYALADKGRNAAKVRESILDWYSRPNPTTLPGVDASEPNGFEISGLVGVVWEWTEDFSAAMAGPELRNSGGKNKDLFCGGASLGAKDASDYAAFMRYSFRASLKATYTTPNLGFRCAKEAS